MVTLRAAYWRRGRMEGDHRHDQVLLSPVAEPGEGRLVPGRSRPRIRTHASRHAQGRTTLARLPGDQSEWEDAGDRGRRGDHLRLERDPALSRREDEALPPREYAQSAGRTPLVALLRRQRSWPFLRPVVP